jgi:hypothetical protein
VAVAVDAAAKVGVCALASRSALRSSQLFFFFTTILLHTIILSVQREGTSQRENQS